MQPILSSLQTVDIDLICFHEAHEVARLEQTCKSIRDEGVLKHPPLAVRMQDGRYLILDGAHRTKALQQLECRRIIVQQVDVERVAIGSWDHLVPAGEWLEELKKHPRLVFEEQPQRERAIAELVEADGSTYYLYPVGDAEDSLALLEAWHLIVERYSREYSVKRLPQVGETWPGADEVLLRYPSYRLQELEQIVSGGHVMPAGVTRCAISGRLLNLRVPLELLLNQEFNQEQWQELQGRWSDAIRLYSEEVYLCEL